jgi:hypothetical protein
MKGTEARATCAIIDALMAWRWVLAIWACGLVRLGWYATALPLWEGYDEWAHFAVLRSMSEGHPLVARDAPIPADVEASLQTVPVAWELRGFPAPARTHDAFWAGEASAGPSAPWPRLTAYEALQPPLYYWLMTPLLWCFRRASLATQVLALRYAAVLLASTTIPLVFATACAVLKDVRLALGSAAVVAVMPGFAYDVARVGNDALAVPLFTALLLLSVRRNHWLALGAVLGLGLLTKAYFVVALAVVLWAPKSVLTGVAIAGWWYARNLWTTGTISGLSEAVMLRGTGPIAMLRRVPEVPWRTAVDSMLFSHIYFGGWSSLMVRSWMYHVFYAVTVLAAVGLLVGRRSVEVRRLALLYVVFWLAQLYNAMLIWLSKGVATSMGWYLYAVVGAEVVLAVEGLRTIVRRWAAAVGVVLFALLDLYAMHFVALPYYTGMIRHKANGALAALHLADARPREMLARLAMFKAPVVTEGVLVALWVAYVAATVALVVAALPSGDSARLRRVGQAGRPLPTAANCSSPGPMPTEV